MKPSDELVAALVACLTEDLHELFQERAAIRQHDGGQSRELTEAMALLDVIRLHPHRSCACWYQPALARKAPPYVKSTPAFISWTHPHLGSVSAGPCQPAIQGQPTQ